MEKIIITFCIILFVVGLFNEPKKVNPITIFFGEWTVIVFLSNMKLYGLLEANAKTYVMILIGCIMYAVGFYSQKWLTNKKKIKIAWNLHKKSGSYNTYTINKKIVYTLAIITVIFFLKDFVDSFIYLIQGKSLSFLRQRAQQGTLFTNPILNAIRILIAAPFSLALTPMVAANFFSKKKNKLLLIATLVILLERLLSDGGRSPFIYLILSFLICFSYSNSSDVIGKQRNLNNDKRFHLTKRNIYFAVFLVICASGLFLMTLSRSGADSLRHTYLYFAMEPIMLQKWNEIVDESQLLGYGMASGNGCLFPLFYILINSIGKVLGIDYPKYWRSIYDMIEAVGTNWQIITNVGTPANSYASIFWTFYLDGRMLGIIIGMFIYGFVVGCVYQKAIKNPSERNLSVYCLVLIGVFYSFQQFIFENIYYSIAFLMLITFMYTKGKNM